MPRSNTEIINPQWIPSLTHFFLQACTIQSPTIVRDVLGGQTLTWEVKNNDPTTYANIPCAIAERGGNRFANVSSREVRREDLAYPSATRIVQLKGHYPDITSDDRALIEDREFNIMAVEHDIFGTVTRIFLEDVR